MVRTISPQEGPQTVFLSTTADIAVYGGAAGGGKSFALLLEGTRNTPTTGFDAVVFRKTSEQIRMAGGLWEESQELFRPIGGKPNEQQLAWSFPSGAHIRFEHLARESDKFIYQGAQIALLEFDELTHFSESQFFYMQSRNRTTCGVRPYTRATCNPDPDSWVFEFLAPWVDPDYSGPFGRAESGELRWFIRVDGDLVWVAEGTPHSTSVTFIQSTIYDNKILLEKDPDYLTRLMNLPLVDRMRLLDASWAHSADGDFFKKAWFKYVDSPMECTRWVRFWDMAATEEKPGQDPDWTVGAKVGLTKNNEVCVAHVERFRGTPLENETRIAARAKADGPLVEIFMEEEGGSSGKSLVDHYARNVLFGYTFRGRKSTGSKQDRAKPSSAHTEKGHVYLAKGDWNRTFTNELVRFPNPDIHDDQVDAFSGGFNELAVPQSVMLFPDDPD